MWFNIFVMLNKGDTMNRSEINQALAKALAGDAPDIVKTITPLPALAPCQHDTFACVRVGGWGIILMKLQITIELDNAAFEDNAGQEASGLLQKPAYKVEYAGPDLAYMVAVSVQNDTTPIRVYAEVIK